MEYPHLGLVQWPFRVVPDAAEATFLADRQQLRADLATLLKTAEQHDVSSIHLFWAWFGAGKTHSLYFLANEARRLSETESLTALRPVYSEFPQLATGFGDVYRTFVTGLDLPKLVDDFLEAMTAQATATMMDELAFTAPDLIAALYSAATGTAQDRLAAIRWLRGDVLSPAQLRQIGVSKSLKRPDDISAAVIGLTKLIRCAALARGFTSTSVIWMLDEIQRIAKLPPRVRLEINAGLHSVFNACPRGLVMILSFSGRPEKSLPEWFSPELGDRIGRTKVLVLPPLQRDEAQVFVTDVLAAHRPAGFSGRAFHPFTDQAAHFIISALAGAGDLKPRSLMQALGAVLEAGEPALRDGSAASIGRDVAAAVFKEYVAVGELE